MRRREFITLLGGAAAMWPLTDNDPSESSSRALKLLGLPPLGGLFAPEVIFDLEGALLANRGLMEAVFRLAWLREPSGLVPVNWRDMETEELGSVYESLLELTPRLTDDGRGFTFAEGGETKGHVTRCSTARVKFTRLRSGKDPSTSMAPRCGF